MANYYSKLVEKNTRFQMSMPTIRNYIPDFKDFSNISSNYKSNYFRTYINEQIKH